MHNIILQKQSSSNLLRFSNAYFVGYGIFPRGGTLGISGWGCAARTLEPLAYATASFSWILLPFIDS